jgi:hypothetical protein
VSTAEGKDSKNEPTERPFIGTESEGYDKLARTELPLIYSTAKMEISLWSILKNNIGKDLTKIPVSQLIVG